MKKKFNFVMCMLVLLALPIMVKAFGSNDDITYKTTFDDKYIYGNVTKCVPSGGSYYNRGILNVSGKKICVRTEPSSMYAFVCDDSDMELYETTVLGSDGNTYYGYACVKHKSEETIKYIEKELYVGYTDLVGDWVDDKCSIISGDSVEVEDCRVQGIKEGESKIKVINEDNAKTKYYLYKIKRAYKSKTDLDTSYNYGNVDKCVLGTSGYSLGGKVNFEDLVFCGSSLPGYNFETYSVSCKDEGYESFMIVFDVDDVHYKGYACRKLKDTIDAEESVEYIKKDIYLGETKNVDPDSSCSVISGDAGYIEDCILYTTKVGKIKIRAVNNKNNLADYYEYNVINVPQTIKDLDSSYNYTDIQDCSLYVSGGYVGYHVEQEIQLDGINFCGSTHEHKDVSLDAKCLEGYDTFPIVLGKDGKIYYSYGCRQKINNSDDKTEKNPVDKCNIIPKEIIKYIKDALKLLRWGALALMIILGTLDFIKAAATDDQDALKKAWQNFIKRLIAVIILFLLPLLVELILYIAGLASDCDF